MSPLYKLPSIARRFLHPRIFLPWILLLFLAGLAHAQEPAARFGQHFLFVLPDTVVSVVGPYRNPARDVAQLVIFSHTPATVKLTAPGYELETVVDPSRSTVLDLLTPAVAAPFLVTPHIRSNDVFEVTSDAPISLICYFGTDHGSEAFVPLPVERWGTEYFAMGLRKSFIFDVGFQVQEEQLGPANAPAEIIIIAAQDSTDVRIQATAELGPGFQPIPFDTTIRLDARQAYLLETVHVFRFDNIVGDISGTRITANQPVAVISGNTRSDGGRGGNNIAAPTGNSLRNTLIEWIPPLNLHGNTFVYRPISPVMPDATEELIRVYATSPGTTVVAGSNGFELATLEQGSFVQFSYSQVPEFIADGSYFAPFAIRTDKPAQAVAITGSFVRKAGPDEEGVFVVEGWSPAMTAIPPREEWMNSARFHAPSYPPDLKHYLVLVADSSAQITLDGNDVAFEPLLVQGTPFRHARLEVTGGDHSIRSVKGRFGAIAYGISAGSEGFIPPGTKKDDDDGRSPASAAMMHPAQYFEIISVAYAYPVSGVLEEAIPPDSLEITRTEECDSTTVFVKRIGLPWMFGPIRTEVAADSANADIQVTNVYQWGIVVGYTITFKPRDPNADAHARLTLTNAEGRVWEIPYSYLGHAMEVSPQPLEFIDVPENQEETLTVTLTNRKPFEVTVRSLTLRDGTTGFSIRDAVGLNEPVPPGGSITFTLAFTGLLKDTRYRDTLDVETSCHTFPVPLRAHTGPSPVPQITGYDWKERRVGSRNDTVSTISNSGAVGFTVQRVEIVSDPAGAFALVDPDWRNITFVDAGDRFPTGISFTPPAPGEFTADIVLTTTDNETVSARLRGVGIQPEIGGDDVDLGILCLRDSADGTFLIRSTGTDTLLLQGIDIDAGAEATIVLAPPTLPRRLAPGESLPVAFRATARSAGNFTATLRLRSNAGAGDSTLLVTIAVLPCTHPVLVADSLDFDSVLVTLSKDGFVTVRNLGGGDAVVTGMALDGDTEGAFEILSPAPPFVVRDSDSVRIACRFTPPTEGVKTARILYQTDAGDLVSGLRGTGYKLRVPAFIRRDYRGRPGEEVTVAIELAGGLDTLPVGRLDISAGYENSLLAFLALMPDSARDHGWRHSGDRDGDSIRATIETMGRSPSAGRLFSMRFAVLLDPMERSEFPFTILTDLPYLEIVESPGLFTRDPICGLAQRLFELTSNTFRLDQNVPNPMSGSSTIEFEIPFDGRATLFVYDALGNERLRLLDEDITAGVYSVQIPAGALSSGMYYYRLSAGGFTATRRLIVQ